MDTNTGYIGTGHHHRDPCLAVAGELGTTITAAYEPDRRVDAGDIAAMDDWPDEIMTKGQDVADPAGGAAVYEDPHELVSDANVDAVWVTCRSDETPETIKSVVGNDVYVVSEKPIARTATDLEDIAKRANELGVTISPTMYYRCDPVMMALHNRVPEGFFGDVRTFDGRLSTSRLSYRGTDHYPYDREASHGGAFQRTGSHWVDVMPWILDNPIARVNVQFHDAVEADVEAGVVLQFETGSGTLGTYHAGRCLNNHGRDTHLGLYGTEGWALTPLHHDLLQHEPTVPLDTTSEHPD